MRFLLWLPLLFVWPAAASTFVGNGGHAGDVELQIATQEIQETLHLIQANQNEPEMKLCVCYSELEGHPICDTLKNLKPEQVKFCSQYLMEHAQDLRSSLSKAHIRWTNNEISVQESQQLRAADAVTDFNRQQITINQKRFLELRNYERVFLLSHELGHLLTWKEQPIQDNQPLGPFTGSDGGREFLNSIAAATVMEALDDRVLAKYESASRRSQGHRDFWLDFSLVGSSTEERTLTVPHTSGAALGARYQLTDHWGVNFEVRGTEGKESYLSTTKATEKIRAASLKFSGRFFPFADPLSFWGQSHFVASAGVDTLSAEYTLADSFIETSDKATSTAFIADLSYYVPAVSGFWFFLRAGYAGHHYRYEVPYASLEMKPSVLTNLGVSYGF